jgi:hypothetical protein
MQTANFFNYESAVDTYFSKENVVTFSDSTIRKQIYLIRKTEIYDDAGYLSSKIKRAEYPYLTETNLNLGTRKQTENKYLAEEIGTKNCQPFIKISIMSTETLIIITRIYKGAIRTISDIGGFTSFSY